MNRRRFLFSSGLALTVSLAPRAFAHPHLKHRDRLAMGTVIFRHRFAQTASAKLPYTGEPLTLLDVPGYYQRRFDLNQVEFWSYHFESLDRGYLVKLRAALDIAGSRLINIQIDTDYNLAAEDPARRAASIAEVKRWIDAAVLLGSTSVRANPGNGPIENAIASMREVNTYAADHGIVLLNENHFGIEMDPAVHLRIREEAGPENLYTLPDFGNYSDDARFDALAKILPYAYLISAKAVRFDAEGNHQPYDYDRCVQMSEAAGFKGIYSVEQWDRTDHDMDYTHVADWLLQHTAANLRTS
ncbi:sugar phosphate isomerase/epimerase family protein [Synoicihabitans lomoniglobus]|uniref:Sugar phosphate isomerase/epimerase n=1 Tax=Synoicihabitans lomoniglobus TaxID=2909285 RepID=A0AAF0I829_9BACT|nr:sugar phosphate isomerase/epimerase [Opitutaceae bacterium LMO-M01]WED67261.1 sugar phosphate isomerase/epimerase [Opitutaceae bacterium LMO-M01]